MNQKASGYKLCFGISRQTLKALSFSVLIILSTNSMARGDGSSPNYAFQGPDSKFLYSKCEEFIKSNSDGKFQPSEGYCENFIRAFVAGYAVANFSNSNLHSHESQVSKCLIDRKWANLKAIADNYVRWIDKKVSDPNRQYDPFALGAVETFGQMIADCN